MSAVLPPSLRFDDPSLAAEGGVRMAKSAGHAAPGKAKSGKRATKQAGKGTFPRGPGAPKQVDLPLVAPSTSSASAAHSIPWVPVAQAPARTPQKYDTPLPKFIATANRRHTMSGLRHWLNSLTALPLAMLFSVWAHAMLLAVNFVAPAVQKLNSNEARLDVILVNAKSASTPTKAEALAQTNLDGGGDKDKGRASSPLARSAKIQDGDDVKTSQQRQQQLEAEQKRLLTALNPSKTAVSADETKPAQPLEAPVQPQISGADLAASSLAIARMEAQIKQQIEDYNKIPRRRVLSPSTREVRYAMYYTDFVSKVERIGRQSFPEEARNIAASSLVVSVVIKKTGAVSVIEIIRESEHAVFNRAARDIIKKAGRFAPFPASMPEDEFEIITRWQFSKEGMFDGIEALSSR